MISDTEYQQTLEATYAYQQEQRARAERMRRNPPAQRKWGTGKNAKGVFKDANGEWH